MTTKQLNPFEQWMVASNLRTIQAGTPAAEIISTLRANGYPQIANGVSQAIEQTTTKGHTCKH